MPQGSSPSVISPEIRMRVSLYIDGFAFYYACFSGRRDMLNTRGIKELRKALKK